MDLATAGAQAKKWTFRVAAGGMLLVVLGSVAYTFFTLNFSYSKGERVGFVQKIAKRGWIPR